MYRKRLICAAYARAYARMNITEDQTRRLMYIGVMYVEIPISTHAQHEHAVQAWTRSESRPTCT